MNAYLDNNILIYIENRVLTLKSLIQTVDSKITKMFYSAAHLHEAKEITGKTKHEQEQRIAKRLETIERVTESNYLYQDLENNVYHQIQNPSVVLKTISEVPFANSAMKTLANFVTEEQRTMVRATLGLETSKLNNYSPDEVIDHLNTKLMGWGQGHSFLELIEVGISHHSQGQSFGRSHRVAGVFELLDILGYWKDSATEKSNYARLWDSNHAFFSSFCDYFISDDKRTRNKAKVVYSIYGIGTKVVSSSGQD